MGRAGRWLKGILGVGVGTNKGKKQGSVDPDFEISSFSSCDNHHHIKDKKRWSFSRNTCHHEFLRPRPSLSVDSDMDLERSRRGLIVRLTADPSQLYWAASTIQATFRGFLARKALKALKGIVKLQSLIRGCMTRKHVAAAGRVVHARAVGVHRCGCHSFDKENVFDSVNWPRRSIERVDETRSSFHSKRNSYTSQKIVGVDKIQQPHDRLSKLDRNDVRDFDRSHQVSTAQGLPLCRSYVKPVMLARSVCGEFPVCREYPNYMARTQSFEAKLRSTRTPKKKQPTEESRRRVPFREITTARNSITSMDKQISFSHYERYTF